MMKPSIKAILKAFSVSLPIYAVLVGGYAFFVLHYLGGWLFHLFRDERKTYAIVALALIIGQGFILEMFARALLGLITGKKE
jgi:nitrate reductase NapE component